MVQYADNTVCWPARDQGLAATGWAFPPTGLNDDSQVGMGAPCRNGRKSGPCSRTEHNLKDPQGKAAVRVRREARQERNTHG